MDKVIVFLSQIIKNDYLLITVTAALPLIELKGSIFLGIAKNISPMWVFFLSYLGSCVVIPIILLCLKPLINLTKRLNFINKAATHIELTLQGKATKFEEKNQKTNGKKGLLVALFLFVAFPAPMTGVWSGAAIAVFLNIDYVKALFAIMLGNLLSGIIVLSIAIFFRAYADTIFVIFLIIALAFLSLSIIIPFVKRLFSRKHTKIQRARKIN